jgi:hypothetical protein
MTVIGKILVFLNLVFCLIVGALVVLVYSVGTNYKAVNDKLRDTNGVLQASNLTYQAEMAKQRTDADARVAEANAKLKKAQDDRDAQAETIKGLRDQLKDPQKNTQRHDTVATASLEEVKLRQADVEKLRTTLKDEADKNVKLVLEKNKLIDRATAAEIQFNAVNATNQRLEGQLQQLARDMARLRANLGATTTVSRGKNPPPESVEGLIKAADAASGLVTITLGSDAGLAKGHTLEVFRLNPIPSQSKYLGTIRILETTHTQAVGQPVGRMIAPPQAGDRVASRILGS